MLGSLGVKGSEYPAAMPFHVVAMRLVMYRDAMSRDQHTENRDKRFLEWLLPPPVRIAVELLEEVPVCITGRRPHEGYGSSCRGMCGPGCTIVSQSAILCIGLDQQPPTHGPVSNTVTVLIITFLVIVRYIAQSRVCACKHNYA